MNNPQGAMIVEIDLKKKKLEEEIMMLEKELQKQEKKTMKEDTTRKDKTKLSVSSRE